MTSSQSPASQFPAPQSSASQSPGATSVKRPRVLVLASECNPEWPSLPIVGYKFVRALSEVCDTLVVTQIRNLPNIRKVQPESEDSDRLRFDFIDTEYVARPLYRFATFLRGGDEVAWSTNMAFGYPPYIEFERQAWKRHGKALRAGEFDIVHRVTPMSPTMPSYMAGRGPQPFVLGPLNGNLPWPAAYASEQKREREQLRKLRNLYKYLPFARRTYAYSDCVLAAFQHTIDDLDRVKPDRIVMFPEVGYDETIFHPPATPAAAATPVATPAAAAGVAAPAAAPAADSAADSASESAAPMRFLFTGRLVPYKLPEVAVRAFAGSAPLRENHYLHIAGDGPERVRLEAIVAEHGLGERVIFEGRRSQSEVAELMRQSDVFVFPSIRELGAGVVVEAMACGMLCLVVDYGGPADLIGPDRGVKIPMAPLEGLVTAFRAEMERAAEARGTPAQAALRANASRHAQEKYLWSRKAEFTRDIYLHLLEGKRPLPRPYGGFADPAGKDPRAGASARGDDVPGHAGP